MKKQQDLHQRCKEDEEIRRRIAYDADTGVFTRLVGGGNGCSVGDRADRKCVGGYMSIRVRNKSYYAHRLAWMLSHGEWPQHQIDHINGDRTDNRLCNLRDVPNRINSHNVRAARASSHSGMLGVYRKPSTGRWFSSITHLGKPKFLGYYATPEEAQAVYIAAKRMLHEGFTL